jgi:hypothetical protein
MKIKKLPRGKVMLEFDEFYAIEPLVRPDIIDAIAQEFQGVRMAYNMWQFNSRRLAEEFVFVYRLKNNGR